MTSPSSFETTVLNDGLSAGSWCQHCVISSQSASVRPWPSGRLGRILRSTTRSKTSVLLNWVNGISPEKICNYGGVSL